MRQRQSIFRDASRNRVLGPVIGGSLVVGYAAVAVLVLSLALDGGARNGARGGSVLAVGFVAASAALVFGALFGFLFGLPRVLERTASTGFLATNTNLDQISDWLTKVLVGLGLVQLGKIGRGVGHIASALAPGLGGGVVARPFAFALLIYSVLDGFLVGYLWTRIVVSIRLKEAAENLARTTKVAGEVRSIPPPASPPPLPPPPEAASSSTNV